MRAVFQVAPGVGDFFSADPADPAVRHQVGRETAAFFLRHLV
ncbi:hypothetical protein [Streptomyces sp. LMG1-1-1.1]